MSRGTEEVNGSEEEALKKFYEEFKGKLLEQYGGDFEGYTGDLASDDGLVVIELTLAYDGPELAIDDTDHWDELMELCTGHCEKWGTSIAGKIGGQWAICGAYSD